MKYCKLSLAIFLAISSVGCSSPANKKIDIASKKEKAVAQIIKENAINETDIDNTISTKDDYVLLGTPFMLEKRTNLPESIDMPVQFKMQGKNDLYQVIEYLNEKYSPYNISIGFSTDAIQYLTGTTSTSTGSESDTQGSNTDTSDSTNSLLNLSQTDDSSAVKSSLSNTGIKIGLNNTNKVTLSHILNDIATRTNLWWKYNDQHQVIFYRTQTKFYKLDILNDSTTYSSNIGSNSASSGSDDSSTSSTSAGSQGYTTTAGGKKALDEIKDAISNIKSSDGKFSILTKLGLLAVTDTPDKQNDIKRIVDQSNLVSHQMVHLQVEIWRLVTDKSTDYGLQADIKRATGNSTASFTGINNVSSSTAGLGLVFGGIWQNSVAKLRSLRTVKSMTLQKAFVTTVPSKGVVPLQSVNEQGYLSGSDISTSDGIVQSGSETATTTNGINLLVSPSVNSDGTIGVQVFTNISSLNSLDDISDGQAVYKRPNRDVLATTARRDIENGKSTLITALVEDTHHAENQSLFGKLLWWLGGSDSTSSEHTTLLIVLTPTIERV